MFLRTSNEEVIDGQADRQAGRQAV